MKRQTLKIDMDSIDWVFEVIGICSILMLLILPWIHYSNLPEPISNHYGADGKADGWGSKSYIWILPIVGTIMHIGLTWLSGYPHKFNYIIKSHQRMHISSIVTP